MMQTHLSSERCRSIANTIRLLSIEAIERANSGHPGAPMGLAELATSLWHDGVRFDPSDTSWSGRDRFVLSCGHASMLLYSLLHLWGMGLKREDLEQFRQWGSLTPGHPEVGHTPGVEVTTGPLGQGCATSVGLALGAHLLSEKIKEAGGGEAHPWSGRRTITVCSDGDLMEGISYEAASLAGHWGLSDLVWFYDDNQITIDGATSITFTEEVGARFAAMNWRVLRVDGHSPEMLKHIIQHAISPSTQPTLVICKTHIGYGSPNKVDSNSSHGSPLGADELKATRAALGWEEAPFDVPVEVSRYFKEARTEKILARQAWERHRKEWASAHPRAAQCAEQFLSGNLNGALNLEELTRSLLESTPTGGATRKLSNETLRCAYQQIPQLIGGSADLSGSNGLSFSEVSAFGHPHHHPSLSPKGRKLHFGIREHAMGAITNGLCLHGSFKSFCGTFLVFSDYVRPAIRLAALSKIPSTFIFTHDSIFLGEDGPTHQPIEHAWALRLIPNCTDFRPADGVEVAMSWVWSLTQAQGPCALMLTRQGLPALQRQEDFNSEDVWRGGYLLEGVTTDTPDVVLVGSGSEVSLCVDSAAILRAEGLCVHVISMPSVTLFEQQSLDYQSSLLPSNALLVSVEAGSTGPWRGIVGRSGLCVGIDRFGASAPIKVLAESFGFTPSQLAERIQTTLSQRAGHS